MNEPVFTIAQAFQLMGLVQCGMVILYLVFCGGDRRRRLMAGAFFLVLAGVFLLPFAWAILSPSLRALLAIVASAVPAMSFLLAKQVLGGQAPPARYLLILLVPLLGAPLFGYAAVSAELCLPGLGCFDAHPLTMLFRILAGGAVLLATMALIESMLAEAMAKQHGKERRGLALALIVVNAATLLSVLAELSGGLEPFEAVFVETTLGLAFIYLTTSMVFRIYPESREMRIDDTPSEPLLPQPGARQGLDDEDRALVARIEQFLTEAKPFKKENFRREDLATALGVAEHRLSRVVNAGFGKSLTDLLNEYRVDEAKRLLATTDLQITQIAFASGFNALASFNRVFRRHVGAAPTQFRQSQNANKKTILTSQDEKTLAP
ncbi:MAG: helix-turn-helix transcriptional regulator [Rhodospirillales bacterium]|nr:helix-turn-helix transcriptional regulator [Rhodospirillales bacterium]